MQAIACILNYAIDSSHIWADYEKMAEIALRGKIVSTPVNYNERMYQYQIIKNMKDIPDTIVIGSSRGMFLGNEILNQPSVYNHCVSGGNLMDYFAILGIYQKIHGKISNNVILEISPWVFSNVSPAKRWQENHEYAVSASEYYRQVVGKSSHISTFSRFSNPIFSFSYLYTNLTKALQNGIKYGLNANRLIAKESLDINEQADYPDGVIRYPSQIENKNEARTKKVIDTSKGPVTYQNCDKMQSIDKEIYNNFAELIDYLQKQNIKPTFFLAPFSESQSKLIFDNNSNPVFIDIEKSLATLANERKIKIIGSYNAAKYNLMDYEFSDFMHGDKESISKIWKQDK